MATYDDKHPGAEQTAPGTSAQAQGETMHDREDRELGGAGSFEPRPSSSQQVQT